MTRLPGQFEPIWIDRATLSLSTLADQVGACCAVLTWQTVCPSTIRSTMAGLCHRTTWGICHAGRHRACGSGAFFDRTCYPGLIGVNFLKTWSGPERTAVTAMQQIADWLKKLGMSEYAQRFVENRIDLSVLPDLTDRDLENPGVLLGDRPKMLRAIRDLGNVSVAVAAPLAPVETEPTRPDDAERRQLTVMFTDLVGSTALSTKLDPEDLRSVIGAYHKCVAETVSRFEGFVAKYMGDGVLIYFGYPHAHEDDAERAVRTGLALIEAVGKLGVQEPLKVRIGVATGLVVVGDLVGSGEAQERGVVGETPNRAARLQGIAAPNTVVIAEGTRRLLGNLFELQDLGPKDLKGIAGPARAWMALRARSVESRFGALHTTGLTTLVGRGEETEMLLRRWARAKTGEGQVVLLGGEAGIGKSRLTAALMERLGGEPHTRLRYFCSPQHTDSALYPIIGQMERAAGLAHDDTPQTRLDKLDAVLAQTSTSIEDAALFAEMMSLFNDGRYPTLDLTPEQRRQRTLQALTALIHVKGYAAPETKTAAERALLLIEHAKALGEFPDDPLLLFSALYGLWVANFVMFNGDLARALAGQFLALAEKKGNSPAHDRASSNGQLLAAYG